MSTSPQSGAQRVIHVRLEHEPEVTQEVRPSFLFSLMYPLILDKRNYFVIFHIILTNALNLICRVSPLVSSSSASHIPHLVLKCRDFTALGYLYSAVSLSLISPENARGVLAAGCLLGGMDDLCGYAYEACKRSMNVDTVSEWVTFVDTSTGPSSPDTAAEMSSTSVFGLYAQRLRDDIFHYLVVILPSILELPTASPVEPSTPQEAGRETLLRVFSSVPFEMFKSAVESPAFQIGESSPRMTCYMKRN